MHQIIFNPPYYFQPALSGWYDYMEVFSPDCNYRDPGKAGCRAYHVIENLKNYIVYIETKLAQLTGPAHST